MQRHSSHTAAERRVGQQNVSKSKGSFVQQFQALDNPAPVNVGQRALGAEPSTFKGAVNNPSMVLNGRTKVADKLPDHVSWRVDSNRAGDLGHHKVQGKWCFINVFCDKR